MSLFHEELTVPAIRTVPTPSRQEPAKRFAATYRYMKLTEEELIDFWSDDGFD